MGKGRKVYGSERLLHPASHVAVADHLAELDEEDVWSVLGPAAGESNQNRPEPDRRRWAAGGLSLAFEQAHSNSTATPAARQQHHHQHHAASSAPMKVPEWPRFPGEQQQQHGSCREEEGEWVAPHEYLQARGSGRGATSVFEGAGRTLKGRDLSRVRDAVWSSTGFFG